MAMARPAGQPRARGRAASPCRADAHRPRADARGPARAAARARHSRPPLRLAARDGDARGCRRLDRHRGAGAVPAPRRRTVEGDGERTRHRSGAARHGGGAGVNAALIVIAKAPLPGRSKTRLSPPLTLEAAARLAEAALRDTLACVAGVAAARRVVALDGEPGDWLPAGFEVVPQRGNGLDERLAAAFEEVGEPAVLIGMDT